MKPFKFDPNAELWTPDEPFEPGFYQTESGLWVPEAYAGKGWDEGWGTYADPGCNYPPITAESLIAVQQKIMESMTFGPAFPPDPSFCSPTDPPPAHAPPACDSSPLSLSSLNSMKLVLADSLQACGGGPIKPGSAVYYNSEDSERAQTETALADFIPNPTTRKRLAELLYIGTQVCCLNIQRAAQHWEAQRR